MTTNKMTRRFAWRFMAGFAAVLAWAISAVGQTVVWGTSNPDVDVPAVQAAVDQGGEVILRGHFSFKRTPTVPTALAGAGYPSATVLVSKAVAISGPQDDGDEMTSIDGGTIPFYVEAPGASVTIHALRFVRPTGEAILVYAVDGLRIAFCRFDGVIPFATLGGNIAIDIDTSGNIPNPNSPGNPEKISGTLSILNNHIDVAGGTAADNMLGITVFSVGVPGAEVEAFVSGNEIKNVTEPAVNFRRIVGRAYVEQNVITTGSVSSLQAPGPEVIRVANIGSYLIAHNKIDCEWPDAEAKGIGVFSQFGQWPMERAIVVDNDVTMVPPDGTVFMPGSAGIDIRGFAQGNVVLNNRIRGSARAALSVDAFKGGIPDNNVLVLNRFDDFEASVADIFVGLGVMNTRILGRGTVYDQGTGTVIELLPF